MSSKEKYFALLNDENLCHYHCHDWFVMPLFDHVTMRVSERHYCHVQAVAPFSKCTCDSSVFYNRNDYECEHIEFVKRYRSSSCLNSGTSFHHNNSSPNSSMDNFSINNSAVDNSATYNSASYNLDSHNSATYNSATYNSATYNSFTYNSATHNTTTDNKNPVKIVYTSDRYFLSVVYSVILSSYSKPAIVWKRNQHSKLSCQSGCGSRSKCQHVAAVGDFIGVEDDGVTEDEGGGEDKEQRKEKGPDFAPCKSTRPIPVPSWVRKPSELQYSTIASLKPFEFGSVLGESKCRQCDFDFADPTALPNSSYKNGTLYYYEFGVPVIVKTVKCPQCNLVNEYDGCEDRIFNATNTSLFSHHLLNQFTSQFTSSQTTLTSFQVCVANAYQERGVMLQTGEILEFASIPTFSDAWFSFILLQEWGFSFLCDICGPHPDNVIADGITLSLPVEYCPAESLRPPTFVDPSLDPIQIPTSTRNIDVEGESVSDKEKRVSRGHRYSHDIRIRKQISIYSGRLFRRYKKVDPLTLTAVAQLIDNCRTTEPELAAMILKIEQLKGNNLTSYNSNPDNSHPHNSNPHNSNAHNSNAHNPNPHNSNAHNPNPHNSNAHNSAIEKLSPTIRILLRLLRILVSDEPLLQFFHHPVPMLLRKCISNLSLFSDPRVRRCLEVMCPFVLELLRVFGGAEKVPTEAWNLLGEAARRADVMAKLAGNRQLPPIPPLTESTVPHDDGVKSGCYYGMKRVRSRPLYSKDAENESVGCDKIFPEYQGITGGAMILWCRHRIAQGFHVISKGEGRNDVFSALYCHWPVAPRVVCYDNACQLMHYSTIREPIYFKNTTFVIDRLHQKNHYACSEAFGLRSFMEGGAKEFFQFNDSAAETGNALLKRIRTSCAYMGKARFMVFVKVFLEVQNRNRQRYTAFKTTKAQESCMPRTSSSSERLSSPMRATEQNYEFLCAIVYSL